MPIKACRVLSSTTPLLADTPVVPAHDKRLQNCFQDAHSAPILQAGTAMRMMHLVFDAGHDSAAMLLQRCCSG